MVNESKVFHHKGGEPLRWNKQALHQILTHQYLGQHDTIFEGIHQIPPAHFLRFRDNQLSLKSYYQPNKAICTLSDQKRQDEILRLLKRAVRQRIHTKAAFSLSAGIDSSSLVALASQSVGSSVPTFTISFENAEYDESPLVLKHASKIGAEVNIVKVTRRQMLDELSDAVTAAEGIAINGQMVAKYRLSQAIRQAGYKTVISAEGADEGFLGYAHLAADFGINEEAHPLQEGIMLPRINQQPNLDKPSWLDQWPTFLQAKLQFCEQFPALLLDSFCAQMNRQQTLDDTLSNFKCGGSSVIQSANIWLNTALSSYILRGLGDGTEMPHSIEGRVPYLDHQLFDLAWSIPAEKKLNSHHSKAILRKALSDTLPPEISQRKKHPLIAPPIIHSTESLQRVKGILYSKAPSMFDAKKVNLWLDQINPKDLTQQKKLDPLIHIILSLKFLEQHYSLSL